MQVGKSYKFPVLCTTVFLIGELISRPWAERGIADDWSYVRSSQLLAKTGHIHYVGWAEAIVGWQLYLAAAFIKLFGFSFTSARLSTLLIALVTVFFIQRTFVRLGLKETYASLGTLTLVMSPLFMILSATMMTDVPGFFAAVICLYGCLRAIQTANDQPATLWIVFAVATNVICGTSRPTAWLGLLTIVPAALWVLRDRRAVLTRGILASLVGLLSIVCIQQWFRHQLYSIDTASLLTRAVPNLAPRYIFQPIQAVQMMGFLLLPVLVAFIVVVPRWPRRAQVLTASLALLIVLLYLAHPSELVRFLLSPFWGEWINLYGVYRGAFPLGTPPILIGRYLHVFLELFVVAAIACTGITFAVDRRSILSTSAFANRSVARTLLLPVSLITGLLLIWRIRTNGIINERYLFVPLLALTAFLLLHLQNRNRPTLPGDNPGQRKFTHRALPSVSLLLLSIWIVYGVVSTHNMFAFYRARVAIGNELLASGVPPSSIEFSWEQDGWYELQQSAHVNNFNGAQPLANDLCHDTAIRPYLHLAPRYGFAFTPNLYDGPAPFAPLTYSLWFVHQPITLYVFKFPPPWKSAIDCGVPAPPPPPQ